MTGVAVSHFAPINPVLQTQVPAAQDPFSPQPPSQPALGPEEQVGPAKPTLHWHSLGGFLGVGILMNFEEGDFAEGLMGDRKHN